MARSQAADAAIRYFDALVARIVVPELAGAGFKRRGQRGFSRHLDECSQFLTFGVQNAFSGSAAITCTVGLDCMALWQRESELTGSFVPRPASNAMHAMMRVCIPRHPGYWEVAAPPARSGAIKDLTNFTKAAVRFLNGHRTLGSILRFIPDECPRDRLRHVIAASMALPRAEARAVYQRNLGRLQPCADDFPERYMRVGQLLGLAGGRRRITMQ